MCLTIAELSPKFMLSKETPHVPPAGGNHTGISPVRTTLFGPRLGPCPTLARGRHPDAWDAHGDGGPTRDGAGHGAALHELPSGPEPGHLVGPPGESDAVRLADGAAGPPRSEDCLR